MANKKISELTAQNALAATSLIAAVQVATPNSSVKATLTEVFGVYKADSAFKFSNGNVGLVTAPDGTTSVGASHYFLRGDNTWVQALISVTTGAGAQLVASTANGAVVLKSFTAGAGITLTDNTNSWAISFNNSAGYITNTELTTHANLTEAHGATGAIVGTTNTQTLTNKTLGSATKIILGSDQLGDLYYQGAANALVRLAASGATGRYLQNDGGVAYSWTVPQGTRTIKQTVLQYQLTMTGSSNTIPFTSNANSFVFTDTGAADVYKMPIECMLLLQADGSGLTIDTNSDLHIVYDGMSHRIATLPTADLTAIANQESLIYKLTPGTATLLYDSTSSGEQFKISCADWDITGGSAGVKLFVTFVITYYEIKTTLVATNLQLLQDSVTTYTNALTN